MYATNSHWEDRLCFSKAHCSFMLDRPSVLDLMTGEAKCIRAASK